MFSKNFVFFDSTSTSDTSNEFGLGGGDTAMNAQVTKLQGELDFELKFQGCVDLEQNKWINIATVDMSTFETVTKITDKGSYLVPIVGFQKIRARVDDEANASKLKVYGLTVN